jgi:hypothetical protein
MTYDPATRRVLFYNAPLVEDTRFLSDGRILAMDVETRTVVKTYEIPAAQLPAGGVAFTGITPGPNGIIVAVESFPFFDVPPDWALYRRVGLSVWDADGSNYRFIDLSSLLPYHIPLTILWTGNSPAFRNTAPALTCPTDVVLACAPAAGVSRDLTAFVTDPDPGQTLTLALKEGSAVLRQHTLATPATDEPVTYSGVLLLPGPHTLTVEVSDGKAAASCSTTVTVQADTTAPVFSGVPGPITVTATSLSGASVSYTPPVANDACAGSVPVSCVPASGATFPVGTTPVTCTAVDPAGNASTASLQVTVNPLPAITWSGVLPPINADGSSVFKAGAVVSVQFQLTGASAGRTDLVARLSYSKVSNNVSGPINEADAPGQATSGNVFQYDSTTGQYYFNWSTKGLTAGTYELLIDLGDGNPHRVRLGLR